MNRKEYLEILDKLNFDKDKYCIMSGGSMIMHNIRECTNDVDLMVLPGYFEELSKKYKLTKSTKNYENLYDMSENIEIKVSEFTKDEIEFINGYPVRKLEKELEWKLENKRPKD